MAIDLAEAHLESLAGLDAAHCNGFRVAGISVQIAGARCEDVALVSALRPFRDAQRRFDVNLQVQWVKKLAPRICERIFDSGTTWRLYQEDLGFCFDFSAPLFGDAPYKRLLVDRTFRHGTIQLSEDSFAGTVAAVSPLDYPLDELLIMHRLTQEKAIELHGCGIVRADGIGNLFVGHSGAGKSTTTRLWTEREDVEILSDDRIIVRRDEEKLVPHRRLAPARYDNAKTQIPRSARDDNASVEQIPHRLFMPVRNDKVTKGIRMYGTPWHGEAMYASPNSAPLARIFVLEHGHGNVLTPLTPSQAVAELFARSFVPFHRHEYVEAALSFLEELVEAVPVYRFSFEPDQRAIDTILNLHD